MAHLLEKTMLQEFQNQLKGEEKAQATIEKYVRDVSCLLYTSPSPRDTR